MDQQKLITLAPLPLPALVPQVAPQQLAKAPQQQQQHRVTPPSSQLQPRTVEFSLLIIS